ncbi:hypothetical protein ABZ488_27585 [Streptomyces griseus]|uniref:hypothetical protein n=1 Tax=Streptomyces griseus TaxID=1911 RepID=UPI0034074D6C
MTAPVRTWPQLLATLVRGDDLTADDTRWAMSEVMDDAHEPVAFAAFLVALRAKGETAGKISGLLGALMDRAPRCPARPMVRVVRGRSTLEIHSSSGVAAERAQCWRAQSSAARRR